jgi:transposase-like protein
VRRGKEFWREIVGELESGAAIAEVARRHRVQPRTLSWWRWKLRDESRHDRRQLLLPVVVAPLKSSAETTYLEVLVGDVIVRVASGSDVAYVAALISALRS